MKVNLGSSHFWTPHNRLFMHFVTAITFFLFAAFQYNDSDAYLWIPIYAIVGIAALLYKNGYRPTSVFLTLIVLYTVGLLLYVPDLWSWIQQGLPSITGSMQAESPFIEFVREFFGLAICLLALVIYWLKSRRDEQHADVQTH